MDQQQRRAVTLNRNMGRYTYSMLKENAAFSVVLSTHDLGELLTRRFWPNNRNRRYEAMVDNAMDYIIERCLRYKLVYVHECWDSYVDLVRRTNSISLSEQFHIQHIRDNPNHRTEFRDTEFPVDEAGMYLQP